MYGVIYGNEKVANLKDIIDIMNKYLSSNLLWRNISPQIDLTTKYYI